MNPPALQAARMALLVALSAAVLCLLLLVSWLIYMPVMALIVAPFTIVGSALVGLAPSAPVNSAAAAMLSAGLACATVASVVRVLLRRARARRRQAGLSA